MLDQRIALELFALAEHNCLRDEAMDLFERCLTEGTPQFLEHFIHQQLLSDSPRLDLLVQVAEDVHQRLMTLRGSLFDVRNQLLASALDEYGVDLSVLAPPDTLDDFHLLQLQDILNFVARRYTHLTAADVSGFDKLFRTALLTAVQLHGDILMTRHMLDFILDWAESLCISSLRCGWGNAWEPRANSRIH